MNNNTSNNDPKNKGPGGFTKEEMGGISDSFSFVSDENDKKMKKNYNYIEEKENDEIEVPTVVLTNDNQQEQLNNMLEERKKQDREFVDDLYPP